MEPTATQHRLLKHLLGAGGAALLSDIKPRSSTNDRDALAKEGWIRTDKQGGKMRLSLTDAGKSWIKDHPAPAPPPASPAKKPRPTKAPKPPKPPPIVDTFPFKPQRLFMLKLAFAPHGEEATGLSKILNGAARQKLVDQKWIEVLAAKPRLHCQLTDAGWQWVEEHLDQPLAGGKAESVLTDVLGRTKGFLVGNGLRLADLLRSKRVIRSREESDEVGQQTTRRSGPIAVRIDLARDIREACRSINAGDLRRHVKLSDLRRALAEHDRTLVDAALLELAEKGQVVLVRMDDPQEIQVSDREAEFRTPSGAARHLLYWTA